MGETYGAKTIAFIRSCYQTVKFDIKFKYATFSNAKYGITVKAARIFYDFLQ